MPPSPPPRILDSHIHLWPQSAANPSSHAWMTPGSHLCKQYSLEDYLAASARHPVKGVVYVETDRRLGGGGGEGGEGEEKGRGEREEGEDDVLSHAAEPLKELSFLRSLIEGSDSANADPSPSPTASSLIRAIIPYAPLSAPLPSFHTYLTAAATAAGPETWARVRGFRFLLQGLRDEGAFAAVVGSAGWVECLRECGARGWCFEVGVDMRGVGVWQVEGAVGMVERVNKGVGGMGEGGVTFVLDHLCKPDLSAPPTTPDQLASFNRWAACMRRFAAQKTYMKLSGAFSELADQDPAAPWSAAAVIARMKPWLDVIFEAFGPRRIMFGSDWPVCNVRGPGDALAWGSWREVVEGVLEVYGLGAEERDRVWFGTAVEAYGLEIRESD